MASPAVIMAPRADGAEVVWAVSCLCRGRIEVRAGGKTKEYHGGTCGFYPQGEKIVRVRFDGLPAGREFEIRAITEELYDSKRREESGWKKFKTLNPAATSSHFVVWNDTHQNDETIDKLHKMTPEADFLLWNGDTCNDWHKEEWLAPTLLNPGGNDMSAGRPLHLVWGNHDMRGKWAFKAQEMIAMPEGRPFYAFRSGPVAFICLHTGEDKPDDHPSFGGRVALEPLRKEQAEWLEQIIQRPDIKNAPYRVVFCHIPLRWIKERQADYSRGEYDHFALPSRNAWDGALRKWGAQVVISGHTHEDAWIPADKNFSYAQLVSGGPKPSAARWIEGKADGDKLRLVMRNLAGETTREHLLPAIRG
ncbi:MAG: metallophosphoesterase [Verrucomicrobiota bacterium]